MYSYISSWFFEDKEQDIEVSPKTKQNRYNVLKEVKQFDKNILLAVQQSLEDFVGETKENKIFTFKRTEKKNDKKRTRTRKRKRKD
jgi:hypothetical protein